MDINDFGIARERGLDLVAIAAIVQRPLASVIARDRNEIRTPADLAGKTIGVTGVPSDDAVLDTRPALRRRRPLRVHRVTIGFNAVADLAAGKVDAATAFWNAEGVQLQQLGIPIREFRVDQFGAPRYPELVVAITRRSCPIAHRFFAGLSRGYHTLGNESGIGARRPAQRGQRPGSRLADSSSSRPSSPPMRSQALTRNRHRRAAAGPGDGHGSAATGHRAGRGLRGGAHRGRIPTRRRGLRLAQRPLDQLRQLPGHPAAGDRHREAGLVRPALGLHVGVRVEADHRQAET